MRVPNCCWYTCMQYYFLLHISLFHRRLRASGLSPLVGWPLLAAGFIGLSAYLFYKTIYAPHLYCLLALLLLSSLSERRRQDFLRTTFSGPAFRQLRLLENIVLAAPFAAFLAWQQAWLHAGLLLPAAALLVWTGGWRPAARVLPTPFGQRPFEFSTGFRRSLWLVALAYYLAIMAVHAVNVNLGAFALLLLLLLSVSFLAQPEPVYYLWIFRRSPAGLLAYKFRWAVLHCSLLCLPVWLLLAVTFPQQLLLLAGLLLLGYLALAVMLVNKYAAYPHSLTPAQAMLLAFSVQLPVIAVVMLPYFYKKAVRQLNHYLHDKD